MGGISQYVKRLKMWNFTIYSLGFLDHLHFCCFDENHHVFKQLEVNHTTHMGKTGFGTKVLVMN